MTFPIIGKDAKGWGLTVDKLGEYVETYPGVDCPAEARKARQWLTDSPTRRKTARGMTKFLNGWMERAQNRSTGNGKPAEPVSRVATKEDLANWNPTDGGPGLL